MTDKDITCWTLIRDAAGGDAAARARFSGVYLDVVRAYLFTRWRGGPFLPRLEDAVQDVFLECFRADGALSRLDPDGSGAFKTWLYAVVRNVALRHEERARLKREGPPPSDVDLGRIAAADESLSVLFDREWARAILRRASERQREWALRDGDAGRRRLELLEQRFGEGRPIRDIARQWNMDADRLHAEFRRAREEFKRALRAEVEFQNPGSPSAIDKECLRLLGTFQEG